MSASKPLYTATVNVKGGRDGRAVSTDNRLEVGLGMPKELGGGGRGTNPEQLFAAGYDACFESAVRFVARNAKVSVTDSSVTGTVELHPRAEGGFKLAAQLAVSLPGFDRATAQKLVDEAHKVCPYSNATRGNIDVAITLV